MRPAPKMGNNFGGTSPGNVGMIKVITSANTTRKQ
jgi:hypothetical protein